MHALKIAVDVAWVAFWVGWLLAAFTAKQSIRSGRRIPPGGVTVLAILILARLFRGGSGEVHSMPPEVAGAVVFVCGIALAVWARIHLGRNWGMPMSQRSEPDLVTSGPYRLVRHPIYSGLLLGLLGTTLVNNLFGLIIVLVVGAYFYYSATIEERNLTATFPTQYPAYRGTTKMLVPFLL